MAKSFLTDIQLNNNVLLNAKIQAWGSAPTGTTNPTGTGTAVTGQISTYLGALYIFNGTAWVAVGSSGTVTSVTGTSPVVSSGGTTPAISLASGYGDTQNPYAAKTANYVLAAPNGSSAAPTFRALVAADIPTLNQNTTGSAAKWTSAVNLAGNSVDGSASVAFANKFIVQGTTDAGLSGAQFLGALGTGIVKNTTSTGVLSIAVAGDFPTLNQNTTGSAGSTTGTLTFGTGLTAGGASFNGSGNVTITPVSATTSVAGIVQLSDSTSTTSSTLAATATAAKAAYDRGSTGVSDAATAQTTANAALPKAGGTMSGAIAMGSNKITGLGTPTAAADAATKDYVDNVSAGINIHDAVVAATTGTVAGVYAAGSTTANPPGDGGTGVGATITYSATGVVTLDTSVTLAQGDRVLVKDGVTAASGASSIANGVYVVTTAGAVGTAAILTRATDSDNSIFGDLSAGDLVYVLGGSTHGGDQFVQTTKGTATSGTGAGTVYSVKIGTDAISYTQFSGAGAVPFATDTVAGIANFPTAQFSVATGAVSITTVNPTVVNNASSGQISGARGGTGVDNTGKTITLGGNLTTSGAFATTLTATGTTTVTLPTSGTLLTTAGSGSSLTFGTGSLSLAGNLTTSGSFTTTLTATANTSVTLPTTGTLATLAGSEALTNKTYNKVTITAPTTGAVLTIADTKTFAVNSSLTLAGTDTTTMTFPGTSATIARTDAAQTFTGIQTMTSPSITTSLTTTSGLFTLLDTATTLNIATGAFATLRTINIGSAASGTGNAQTINLGVNSTTTATSLIYIGGSTSTTTTITGTVVLPTVANSTAGFIKTATDGTLSRSATIANSEMATSTSTATATAAAATGNVTNARKAIGAGIGTGTAMVVNHGLGQWVTAQLYDTSGNLVEVDVLNASTSGGTTTFTFSSSQTLTGFQYVIVG